jgi:hypothetical protein
VEQAARFEEVKIELPEPLLDVEALSAVVGIPEWWPTGSRVAVAIAHDSTSDMHHPLVEAIHRELAVHRFLTVRFNFPFAETGRPASDYSAEALERAYRAALSILGRDPTAAPSHLFLGGMGIGGRVAARLATARLQIDGAFFLGFPLHAAGKPDQVQTDQLFRIISPMLFVQGTEDPYCDLGALRTCLKRIGAPTSLQAIEGATHALTATPAPPAPPPEEGVDEEAPAHRDPIASVIATWMDDLLGAD